MDGYVYLDSAEKVQFKARCIMDDNDSPMEYKSDDGHLASRFYYVEPILGCDDLMDEDLCFYEYIGDDEEMSEKENEECVFHIFPGDNFV